MIAEPWKLYRHYKGGVYVVVGFCKIEAGWVDAVQYVPVPNPNMLVPIVRPISEFQDGRFTEVTFERMS